MKELIFYNHFNNGDIHLSRGFIKVLTEKMNLLGVKCFYAHKNNLALLKDINVTPAPHLLPNLSTDPIFIGDKNSDQVFLNTWYAADKFSAMNRYGLSFDCLYSIFNHFTKNILEMDLSEIRSNPMDFFPDINFSMYDINNIDSWATKNINVRKVFISNGPTLSGQGSAVNFTPVLNYLAKKYKDIMFITTSYDPALQGCSNVINSVDIIGRAGFDLNENAYLSTKCNLILGKSSGPFTFSFIKKNLFEIGQTFISFSNLSYPHKFWLSEMFAPTIEYKSKIINQDVADINYAARLIEENIP